MSVCGRAVILTGVPSHTAVIGSFGKHPFLYSTTAPKNFGASLSFGSVSQPTDLRHPVSVAESSALLGDGFVAILG